MTGTMEQQWDLHGVSLWVLACALLGNREAAMTAIASAMVDQAEGADRPADEPLRAVAGLVYRRCDQVLAETTRSMPALTPSVGRLGELSEGQRTALALCTYGGHTYRDAALVLGLRPEVVAALLISGLHDLVRLGRPA